jgi:hypothetical protein
MRNNGRAYERLIQTLYDQILRLNGVQGVTVEHDVTLQGLKATHQIDVFWKFTLAGIEHQVIIQAKNWATAVDQGAVLLFDAVLTDLPGQPRGVMVARSGFQSGASDVARAKGIVLYELREPEDADFEGGVKQINIGVALHVPEFRNFSLVLDEAWVAEHTHRQININASEDQLMVRDSAGEVIENLHIAKHRLLPQGSTTFDWRNVSYEFPEPVYLDTGDAALPSLKLRGFTAEARVTPGLTRDVNVSYRDLFTHIFTSLTGSQTYFVDTDGKVQQRG